MCSEKYIKEETHFLLDMFVENGHKRTFGETGYLTLDQKFKKNLKNVDKDITFISGKDLQILLCQDKPKLLPNSHPGVYQLDCSCNGKYICESKKKILKGCIEHQQDSIKGDWEPSSAAEHTKQLEITLPKNRKPLKL